MKKQQPKKLLVKNITHLKTLIKQGYHDYYITLNYGIISSKYIEYNTKTKKFYIFNESDGSEQKLTTKQLKNKAETNIGASIKIKGFICKTDFNKLNNNYPNLKLTKHEKK